MTPTCPVPLCRFDASDADYTEAVLLPSACYADQSFFDFEMEAVFGHEWICLGSHRHGSRARRLLHDHDGR